jgi:hypothetical protein
MQDVRIAVVCRWSVRSVRGEGVVADGPVGGLPCGGKHFAATLAARLRRETPGPFNGASIPY